MFKSLQSVLVPVVYLMFVSTGSVVKFAALLNNIPKLDIYKIKIDYENIKKDYTDCRPKKKKIK